MNIVLLNSTTISKKKDELQDSYSHLRTGISSIAAFARKNGFGVSVIDPHACKMQMEALVDKIVGFHPRFVGMSAYTEEIFDAAKIAFKIKERNPNITIVLGGPHISALPVETFQEFQVFDIGVIGEGELTFLDIVQSKDLKDIQGIIYRKNGGDPILNPHREDCVSLDSLPFPAWDLYELNRYRKRMPVEVIRGCPFSCTFCFKSMSGRRVRYKSSARLIEELRFAIKSYNTREFGFGINGTFPIDKKHALDICESIIESGLNIRYITGTRVDLVDERILLAMKKSGCTLINFGIESADIEILKKCGKNITPEKCENVLKLANKIGIQTSLNFILGLPGENRQSLEATRKFVMKNKKYAKGVNFAILVPYPGTLVFDMALKNENGLRLMTKDWAMYGKQGGMAIDHDNFKPGQLKKYQLKFYIEYVLRTPSAFFENISVKRIVYILKSLLGFK